MNQVAADQVALLIEGVSTELLADAKRCAREYDFAGLAFIVNTAHGWGGFGMLRFGYLADIAELLRDDKRWVVAKSPT